MTDKMENKAPVIITFNEKEYRAEDLNEAQTDIAAKLNITGRQLSQLKEAYETYLVLNDYKNIMIKAFEATTENGNEETSEDNS
jgi:hypothetical protein|tara:strand:- start:1787 stop:2038 length:252 start_codon:yes stop_codon:yes gene_type:complete